MASLINIPSKYRKVLIGITSLHEEAISELRSALGSAKQALISREEALNLASQLTSISKEEGMEIIEALLPLYILKGSSDKTTTEFIDDIIYSLKQGAKEETKLSPEQVPLLIERLADFLGLKSIDLSAKALSVQLEQQRSFQTARILSDIRPVFNHDVSEPLASVVLIHNLKIEYLENGEAKEFFVAMDGKDLKKLRDTLERANQKESSIRTVLSRSEMNIIELSEEE